MNRGIVIFIEGYTEEGFYKKVIEYIRSNCDKKCNLLRIIIRNLKGIGNYKNKAHRIFCNEILPRYPEISFKIFLCYDNDVFEFSKKPPVKWKEVEKVLRNDGAEQVIHIKAKKSIEDWFLKDLSGLCRYLNSDVSTKIRGSNGIEKMNNLFKKANKVYIKGGKSTEFIGYLEIKKIMKEICKEIRPLCKELGIKCNGDICKS